MRKILLVYIILPLMLFAINCEKIAIETIIYEPDGSGFRQFSTNDTENCGWSFWYWMGDSWQSTTTVVETEVKKLSGCNYKGAGIVFCLNSEDDFTALLIDTNGNYLFTVRYGDEWITIIPWSFSNYLNRGYNVVNNLKVLYDSTLDEYQFYFNGNYVSSMLGYGGISGYSGYLVVIGSEEDEDFPDDPVDVRFRQIQPTTDP